MDILRTPDERFAALPDFDYDPHYVDKLPGYAGLRVHYVDVGGDDAERPVFLCLHGQPSWSYLYRHMIPLLTPHGRVVAPDLLGFGRSDKPVDDEVYSFDFHRGMLLALIEQLDLRNITLVCQDWGGLLGLTLPLDMPSRFSRLLVMNTALGTGDVPLGKGFHAWRDYAASRPDLDIAALHQRSSPHLTAAECAAYAAPHPDRGYKAGVRRFPAMVPEFPDDPGAAISRRARTWWQNEWSGQSFMAIGGADPVLGEPSMRYLHGLIRGCPPPLILPQAGHFVQEWGREVVPAALASWQH